MADATRPLQIPADLPDPADGELAALASRARGGDAEAARVLGDALLNGAGSSEERKLRGARWLKAAARTGDPESMFLMALAYAKGAGVRRDQARSLEWLERAAARDHPLASYRYGAALLAGLGGARRSLEGVEEIRRAAVELESIAAMEHLSVLYLEGQGVPKSLEESARWARAAAEGGNPNAMFRLAGYIDAGQAEGGDAAWWRWIRRAAELGHRDAALSLGRRLLDRGGAGDQEEGLTWHARAAELGNVWALAELGNRYAQGDGVPTDSARALECFRRAALEFRNAEAQFRLAMAHASGEGVRRDGRLAADLLEHSARGGFSQAYVALAELYRTGREPELPADAARGLFWLRKGWAQKHHDCAHQLARWVERGWGSAPDLVLDLVPDLVKARELHEQAAAAGNVWSLLELARYAESGLGGLGPDGRLAARLLRRAQEKIPADASLRLGSLLRRGGPQLPADPAGAAEQFARARSAGSAAGTYWLARCHEEGAGAPLDPERARALLEEAAAAGYAPAAERLRASAR